MKKTLIVLTIGFITVLCASRCDKPCYDPDYYTKIDNVNVALFNGTNKVLESTTAPYVDLRLKMNIDLSISGYANNYYSARVTGLFPMAYADSFCHPENLGLTDDISEISLVCDKTIGDLEAGRNLISEITTRLVATVHIPERTLSFDKDEWITLLNVGYVNLFYLSEGEREFDVIFMLPETTIQEDEYTFTLILEYVSGENPNSTTFPAIRLH